MQKTPRNSRYCIALFFVAGGSALAAIANAADAPPPQIPTCDKKIGTLAVTEPQNQWWTALNLESPAALIKVFVSQSKCFTLVDRGKGLQAAQAGGRHRDDCGGRWRRDDFRARVQRSLSRSRRPPASTQSGIQKWMSVTMARNRLRGAGSVLFSDMALEVDFRVLTLQDSGICTD